MISTKATDSINQAVIYELRKIIKDHGIEYHSTHEGYAILLEEAQECTEEAHRIGAKMELLWNQVRCNKDEMIWNQLEEIKQAALSTAEEAVQVAAVCEKFKETMTAREIFGEKK